MEHGGWLVSSLVYLAAAVIAVPLAKALGLGSVIGYLAAGIVIGPWGLALVSDANTIMSFAEFGVVLMLFLIGLELEPQRLIRLRVPIFGWGSLQLFGSAALLAAAGIAFGVPWPVAVAAALGLALSSTAIGLAVLNERNVLNTTAGQGVLSVALLQDVAAIPILALLPLLGTTAATGGGWLGAAKAAAVIAVIIVGGRLLLRPTLRWIARSDTPEIFTAASLLLVVATAALMHAAGLSMALGAFLAGVLLAESEYRRELETDLEPFKGLLLGLFFIAVGMSIDFDVVLRHPWTIAAVVLGFVAVKALVLVAMTRPMRMAALERPLFTILLAQGGEFGFVVFQTAAQAGVIDAPQSSLLVAAVAISMLLTPLLLVATDRWLVPRLAQRATAVRALREIDELQSEPVVIAGFGRYGQIVGRLLFANGVRATVLEHDADQIEVVRRFGWRAFYGDATRLDLLRTAGAERARVIVVAVDDVQHSLEIVDLVREHFPRLQIVARARNVSHWYELRERGVQHIERETLDSALMSARSVLEVMGFQPHEARTLAMRFRRHTIEQLEQQLPHHRDETRLIAIAKAGRQQLESLFAQEREAAGRRRSSAGWQPSDDPPGPAGPASEGLSQAAVAQNNALAAAARTGPPQSADEGGRR